MTCSLDDGDPPKRVVGTPDKCVAAPQPAIRVYSNVEPASPKIPRPGDRSRMSTTRAKGPGSNGAPGLWALRSLTTRSRAADNACLVIPVAMISATITSLTGPRISTTSSYDNSANSSLLSLSKAYSVPGALASHLLEKSSFQKPRPVISFFWLLICRPAHRRGPRLAPMFASETVFPGDFRAYSQQASRFDRHRRPDASPSPSS
jgi:hypothetical protein